MINSIHIQNFKCLRDVKVDLEPFTVLIGPNDSGKSSFLDAMYLLSRSAADHWHRVFVGPSAPEHLVWRGDRTRTVELTIAGSAGGLSRFEYSLQLSTAWASPRDVLSIGGNLVAGLQASLSNSNQMLLKLPGQMPQGDMGSSPAFTALAEVGRVSRDEAGRAVWALLSSITRHHFLPQELRKPAALTKAPRLSESGDNLAAVLDALVSGPDRDAINNLEKGLRESIPSIKGISLPTVEGSNPTRKELMYSLSANGKGSLVIPAQSVSEGALLLTAYLALVFGETAEVLLIEEPENGLHPERLATVIELLRKIASGAFGGHPRQVVITTHNPILLNYVEPKEVRVFQRDPEKGTFVKRMDEAPGIEKLTKTFGVGELWYMLGEKKLFDPEPAA